MTTTPTPENPQPEITYPTRWSYRIVGTSEPDLRAAIQQILNQQNNSNDNNNTAHTLTPANQSTTGKYLSLNLELTVQDEPHRHQIFNALSAHPHIRFVL